MDTGSTQPASNFVRTLVRTWRIQVSRGAVRSISATSARSSPCCGCPADCAHRCPHVAHCIGDGLQFGTAFPKRPAVVVTALLNVVTALPMSVGSGAIALPVPWVAAVEGARPAVLPLVLVDAATLLRPRGRSGSPVPDIDPLPSTGSAPFGSPAQCARPLPCTAAKVDPCRNPRSRRPFPDNPGTRDSRLRQGRGALFVKRVT